MPDSIAYHFTVDRALQRVSVAFLPHWFAVTVLVVGKILRSKTKPKFYK
jgi:hypothetical protein